MARGEVNSDDKTDTDDSPKLELVAKSHAIEKSGFDHLQISGATPSDDKSTRYSFNALVDENGNLATRNLHVSGYGIATTPKQIEKLFSQYACVVEVVPKLNIRCMFVHTADRDHAIRARHHLIGARVNDGILRVNFAKE